jgi:hypothetical protein
LFAFALSETHVGDWRDLLVSLAPYHHCAQKLAMDIPRLFDQVTPYALPDAAPYFETFGRRTDVTLGVFGWREIDTPYGKRIHSP